VSHRIRGGYRALLERAVASLVTMRATQASNAIGGHYTAEGDLMDTPASKTTHSFQRATWSLRWGLGCCVGALLLTLASSPAYAAALSTNKE